MEGLHPFAELIASLVDALRSPAGYAIATWFLALVFLWSGAVKLRRPGLAAVAVAQFRVVRRPTALHGALLGALEVGVGLALVTGRAMTVVLAVTLALLATFTVLVGRSLLAGESFPCLCFGEQDEGLSGVTLLRTSALGLLAALLLPPLEAAARAPLDAETYLALVTAVAALMTIVLLGRTPRLVRLNRGVTTHFRSSATGTAA